MATVMYKDLEGITRVFGGDGEEPEQTFDPLSEKAMSGKAIAEVAPFRLGIDEFGRYGYYKDGADTVTPFKQGEDAPTWERPAEWPNLDLLPLDEQVIYMTLDNSTKECFFGFQVTTSKGKINYYIGTVNSDGEFEAVQSYENVSGTIQPQPNWLADLDIDYPVLKITPVGDFKSFKGINVYDSTGVAIDQSQSQVLEFYFCGGEAFTKPERCGGYVTQHIKLANCPNLNSAVNCCYYTKDLRKLDIENCDFSAVTSITSFLRGAYYLKDVSFLKEINITSTCTNIYGFFQDCYSIEEIDISHWDLSNIVNTSSMFSGCNNLKRLNMNGCNLKKVTNVGSMLTGTFNLEEIDLTTCDFSLATTFTNCFNNCKIVKGTLPTGIGFSFQLNGCVNKTQLLGLLNQLPTISTTATVTVDSNLKKSLTASEIAALTDRGWTIA